MSLHYQTADGEIYIRPQTFFQRWTIIRNVETSEQIEHMYIGYVPQEDFPKFKRELNKLEDQMSDDVRKNRLALLDIIGRYDRPKILVPKGQMIEYVEEDEFQEITHTLVEFIYDK